MSYRELAHVVFIVLFAVMVYLSNSFLPPFPGLLGQLVLASVVEIIFWSFDALIRKP